MKLYYKTGTCSLAPHIVMCEQNMVYELEAVDFKTKTTANGDYMKVNPKGSVPAMKMDNGEILTEGPIISQYIADQKGDGKLLGKFGTLERYRCLEWMNFITSEVHKSFSPLFGVDNYVKNPEAQVELKNAMKGILKKKCQFVSEKLGTNDYLMGHEFSIADAYLFTCLGWSKHVGFDLNEWSNIANWMKRVSERPAVQKAMKESGLMK